MKRHFLLVLAAAASVLPAVVTAAETDQKDDQAWEQELELAYILKRGNSVSDTFQGKYNGEKETPDWRHTAKLQGSNTKAFNDTSERNERTGERYFASYKLDKILENKNNYVYNIVTYDDDNFSGFEYEASYSIGIGRRLIHTDTKELDVEIGPGYRVKRFEHGYADEQALINFWIASGFDNHQTLIKKQINEDSNFEKGKSESGMVRLAAKFDWDINENVNFKQELSSEVGRFTATSRSITSLSASLNETLSVRLSHLIKHNSRVPQGKKEADHETTASIVYFF